MALNQEIVKKIGVTEVDLTSLLVSDVTEIFSTMVGVSDIFHLPQEVEVATHFKDSVSAMVGLAGACNGLVCIHTSKTLAQNFTSGMLGMEVTEIGDDVIDALGEIANMIGGSFKHHISCGGDDVKLSIPSVVTGSDYSFSSGHSADTIALLFTAQSEKFMVCVVLKTD